MIEEQAIVVRTQGNQAIIEIERNKPCGLCGATKGCGISLWSRIFGNRHEAFSTENKLAVKVGDHIIIGVEEGVLLTGSLIAYAIPLLMLFIGAGLGSYISDVQSIQDMAASIGALLGLALGLALVRVYTRTHRGSGRYHPVMLRRAEKISNQFCMKVAL